MIAGILLAAGDSTRMGEPKALLPFEGTAFIDVILDKLSAINCEPIISILGNSAEMICRQTSVNTFQCFRNPHPELGQLSSLKIAIEKLPENVAGFVLTLVDHPAVKLDTYQNLIEMARSHPKEIIIPEYQGKRGHPVYFGKRFFKALLDAPLETGARSVVQLYRQEVKYLPVNDKGILVDIDTPEDFREINH